jgi:hypothetical protein
MSGEEKVNGLALKLSFNMRLIFLGKMDERLYASDDMVQDGNAFLVNVVDIQAHKRNPIIRVKKVAEIQEEEIFTSVIIIFILKLYHKF